MKRFLALTLAILLVVGAFPASASDGGETAAPDEAAAFTPLEYGDQGDAVTAVQERLTQLGYYTGKVSGNYLEGTQAGVRRFQKDYGLEQTGRLDEETYRLLQTAEYRPLKNGDDGVAVGRLQERLIELNYLTSKVTNKFRSATEGAVRAFQKQNGLPQTGEADQSTQRLLFSDQALAKGVEPTPTPGGYADLGDVNDIVMVDDGESTRDSLSETPFDKKLSRGDQSDNVKLVQTRLTELGFFNGPISGYYMDQTIAAVKSFREYNGLPSTKGEMDEETWNLLFNTTEVVSAANTPKPTPVPTPIPYHVVVDAINQVTSVYGLDETGEYTKLVRQMICSTGTDSHPSPVGDWVTTGRRARWCYFSIYGSHAQYWTRINSDVAFHSVIYASVDYKALKTTSYKRLGKRASHGCIRLTVEDAKWVYDNIREGITVTITEDIPLDEELTKSLAPAPLNTKEMVPEVTPAPTPSPVYVSDGMPPQPFREIQVRSVGEDVYWLQCKLKELGYYNGTITGAYYGGTREAVRAYQKANDLYPSGKASIKTLEALYADILAANTPTPEPTASPEPTPEPLPTPEAAQ